MPGGANRSWDGVQSSTPDPASAKSVTLFRCMSNLMRAANYLAAFDGQVYRLGRLALGHLRWSASGGRLENSCRPDFAIRCEAFPPLAVAPRCSAETQLWTLTRRATICPEFRSKFRYSQGHERRAAARAVGQKRIPAPASIRGQGQPISTAQPFRRPIAELVSTLASLHFESPLI